ncbi:MAG: ArsR/SmtB family transcription factor [Syntrophothermus sp.]
MIKPLPEELQLFHAQICQALADPKRIAILYELREGTKSVGELAKELELGQVTTSRHLKVLRERGLVQTERNGQNIYYSLTDTQVTDALDKLREVMMRILRRQQKLAQAIEEADVSET